MNHFEIVCAHYTENLAWLNPVREHVLVYHKGPPDAFDSGFKSWICLPNVGREAHTYLTFIIDRYDTLPETTAFVQNGAYMTHDCIIDMVRAAGIESFAFYSDKIQRPLTLSGPFTHINKWADRQLRHEKMDLATETFDQYYRRLFDHDRPARIKWFMGATFAVRRDRIRMRPKAFYEHARQTLHGHRHPEQCHFMERLWFVMFT